MNPRMDGRPSIGWQVWLVGIACAVHMGTVVTACMVTVVKADPPTQPTPEPAPTAAPPMPAVDEISEACEWYRAHGCREGDPTPEGRTCEDVSATAAEQGIDIVARLDCLRAAPDCDVARACPTE